MSLNRVRDNFAIREKPMIGDVVGDVNGDHFDVITVGLKYMVVKNKKNGKSFTMRVGDAYIVQKAGSSASI